jgi:two-component system NtrC family sensor kinase
MTDLNLRVLFVEDNPLDAELVELALMGSGYVPHSKRVQTAREMQAALDSAEWDLILSDYNMPRFTGLEALKLLQDTEKDIPFILISGSAGEDAAVEAMRAGAQDFFTKGSLGLLIPAIQRELREAGRRATARAQREQLHQNEKLAALGTLLAGIAHELNNPLSVIMHQSTLLQGELHDDPRQDRANSILRAVTTCARIVRNFLALARQETPRRVPVSVNDLVRAVIDFVAYGLKIDGVTVDLDLTEPMPEIAGDPQQLERVVLNLVSNAQYAVRPRPAPRLLTVRTSVDPDSGRVLLSIADNGSGIPPEIRSRIFEPFFTTKPTGQGTGLGLSLCHGIIASHGGTITVDSEIGSGTTFVIALPISDVPAPIEETTPTPMPTPPLRVLVVDDDAQVALAFSEILTAQGHDVDVAVSSRAAVTQAISGQYRVILSDTRMPDLDGPAFYREVTSRCPELRDSFLFVTGDSFSDDTDRFLKETGVVHLSKPCTFDEVADGVAEVLRRAERLEVPP